MSTIKKKSPNLIVYTNGANSMPKVNFEVLSVNNHYNYLS